MTSGSLRIFSLPTFYVSCHPEQFSPGLELLSGEPVQCPGSLSSERVQGSWPFLSRWSGSIISSRSRACLYVKSCGSTFRTLCSHLSRYLLARLLSKEVSPSAKEMRTSRPIPAHQRPSRLVVYRSLWCSWEGRGRVGAFPQSTCTVTSFHMDVCFESNFCSMLHFCFALFHAESSRG